MFLQIALSSFAVLAFSVGARYGRTEPETVKSHREDFGTDRGEGPTPRSHWFAQRTEAVGADVNWNDYAQELVRSGRDLTRSTLPAIGGML